MAKEKINYPIKYEPQNIIYTNNTINDMYLHMNNYYKNEWYNVLMCIRINDVESCNVQKNRKIHKLITSVISTENPRNLLLCYKEKYVDSKLFQEWDGKKIDLLNIIYLDSTELNVCFGIELLLQEHWLLGLRIQMKFFFSFSWWQQNRYFISRRFDNLLGTVELNILRKRERLHPC